MSRGLWRRLALTVLAAAGLTAGLVAVPPAAHAGQVGITIGIQGAGAVSVVEGSLADDAPTTCRRDDNQDHRVTVWCPRVRSEAAFEAWVWLHPYSAGTPAGEWVFDHWEGCDQTRKSSGWDECAVRSGAFSSDEKQPVAVFRDTRAPSVAIQDVVQSGTETGRFTLTFTATNGAPECSVDGGAFAACRSPLTAQFAEGDHQFALRGVDPSGNVSGAVTTSFSTVDTTWLETPARLTNARQATFRYSSLAGQDFLCSTGGGSWRPCGTGPTGQHVLTDLADGEHTLWVEARKGGWYDVTPATYTWRVDTVAPTATLTAHAATDRSARFTFAAPAETTATECRLTGPGRTPTWTACTSPVGYTDLGDGAHVFEVRARDGAGNVQAAPATHRWTVSGSGGGGGPVADTTAPETTLGGGPAQDGWSLSRSAAFTLGSSESGSLTCTLDGQARPCAPGALTLDGLGAGTHTLAVAATDGAGNRDASPATRTWTVPRTAAELPKRKGWRLRTSAAAYGGKVLQAKRKKATLVVPVTQTRRLALVVSGGRKQGTVKVLLGKKKLGTVRLAGKKTVTQRLVALPALPAAYTGDVRVVVTTSGRPVRIEGLGAATP